MKKSRYTEEQIVGILKQHEAGMKTADWLRVAGPSRPNLRVHRRGTTETIDGES